MKTTLSERLRTVVRFALPHNATVVLIDLGDPALLALDGRTAWAFWKTKSDETTQSDNNEAIAQLEALRTNGGAFLVIPSSAFAWLAQHQGFQRYLEQRYRLVLRENDTCVIFALQEPPDTEWRQQGAPDSLPLPSPELIALVTGISDVRPFYWGGVLGARCIKGILNKNGIDINRLRTILDFGCGCGRILRHWRALSGPALFGTDYNPYLVRWCQNAFPFATFAINDLAPPLAYKDTQFELIYTVSIFTHLDEPLQIAWIRELTRLLAPGGYLFLTVHGTTRVHTLPMEQQERFAAGELVVYGPELSGSNHCSSYHPESYVRRVFAQDLTVVDFVPGGAKDANQDVFLLQKPMQGN